jgi:hypothetical protein
MGHSLPSIVEIKGLFWRSTLMLWRHNVSRSPTSGGASLRHLTTLNEAVRFELAQSATLTP